MNFFKQIFSVCLFLSTWTTLNYIHWIELNWFRFNKPGGQWYYCVVVFPFVCVCESIFQVISFVSLKGYRSTHQIWFDLIDWLNVKIVIVKNQKPHHHLTKHPITTTMKINKKRLSFKLSMILQPTTAATIFLLVSIILKTKQTEKKLLPKKANIFQNAWWTVYYGISLQWLFNARLDL